MTWDFIFSLLKKKDCQYVNIPRQNVSIENNYHTIVCEFFFSGTNIYLPETNQNFPLVEDTSSNHSHLLKASEMEMSFLTIMPPNWSIPMVLTTSGEDGIQKRNSILNFKNDIGI